MYSKREECQLSKALVSRHWTGMVAAVNPIQECFSSWAVSNDAIPDATIDASSTANDGREKEMPAVGYYCYDENGYVYSSALHTTPWWAADLGTVRRIYAVRILTRRKNTYPPRFQNVEVRVGNVNLGNGDFSANKLLGLYEGEAGYGEVINFNTSDPISGSVVSVQSINTQGNYLILPDIQILYM
ncbi:hypothetical protein SK128_009808 [Halocaridina rubra]|uniref:Fucolectin tachylectin-4 pentraxin-1 domain-containing protein n=1 Tax=Halocaridina rubra TaxID=373956 RepID=A0AAN8XCZ3_HALRR